VDVFEALRTTRAMRRLDPDRPVADEDLLTIVEMATKGPSGGNGQPVRWIVVTDRDLIARLGDIYRRAWAPASQAYWSRENDDTTTRVLNSADHLGEHMGEVPAIIIPASYQAQAEASVYGPVQNLQIAARALGLGTALTTVHRRLEDEVREVLGLPEDVHTWAMIPVGYPLGRWGEAERRPVREVTYWNGWKQPPPV
jgi:nitroreductase